MAASVYGSLGKYGITDESAKGLYAASLTLSGSNQQAWVPNHIGEDIGVSLYNESADISIQGITTNAATTTQSLQGVLDIANTDIYGTDSGVSVFFVTGINLSRTNTDFETGDVSATGRAGITDNTATSVT